VRLPVRARGTEAPSQLKGLRGGVPRYVAQATPQFDAEIKVVSRTRTTNKKRRTGNKKPYQRKGWRVRLVVLVVVFAGVFSYALYRSFTTKYTQQPLQPLFETYPSEGIEAEIKEIDRRIYDALLDLNIPATDVTFKTVEPRRNLGGLWSFSELEIRVPATVQQTKIKKAFLRRVSKGIQKESLRFASGTKQELILDLSVDGHHTHRLLFVKRMEKRPLES
jgi:hypothetical protein